MAETYISLEEAAELEDNTPYNTFVQRIKRNPNNYKTCEEPRPEGGRPLVSVALSSLRASARKAYKAAQKIERCNAVQDDKAMGITPWYVNIDWHWYIDTHEKEYYKAIELKNNVLEFIRYDDIGRTEHAEEFAEKLGISSRSLYRYTKDVVTATAWAKKREAESGRSHDYFQVLCLCRKPRQAGNFPSLTDELKAQTEAIYFNTDFRRNRGTRQMVFDELRKQCLAADIPPPSYQTVVRYINSVLDSEHGESANYLAENGLRSWKNKYMMKGERDLTQLQVMGLVMGDEHTFDLWVSYIAANGKVSAMRPKLITWIDTRSRKLLGYEMCKAANSQDIKNSFVKFARVFGAPLALLIDNGKDYTAKEMTGQKRSEREIFDAEMKGFYRAMGVTEVHRSRPYEPWSKGVQERVFGTLCTRFSKRFKSYVGTLTGSKTDGKIPKDINKMLERGELYTIEEFFAMFEDYAENDYAHHLHRGLKDSGERYTNPAALFENAEEHYFKPAPPDSYIAMLLMQSKTAAVKTTGIQHNKRRYMSAELRPYINKHVQIRYMPDDDSIVYAFTEKGELIGEIALAEKLNPVFYADREQLERHKSNQNRQLRDVRDKLRAMQSPYTVDEETGEATPRLIGGVDLTVGKKPGNNAVTLPVGDKQYRQSLQGKKKNSTPNPFLDNMANKAFDDLKKIAK